MTLPTKDKTTMTRERRYWTYSVPRITRLHPINRLEFNRSITKINNEIQTNAKRTLNRYYNNNSEGD